MHLTFSLQRSRGPQLTSPGGGWSRSVLAEWRSIIHTHYVAAVFLQLFLSVHPSEP